jgi:hypothetical protein
VGYVRQYTTIVKRARFQATTFPAATMQAIAEPVRLSVRNRISLGRDVWDNPAPQLRPKYQARKEKKPGRSSIRDWKYSYLTMDSMHVLQVGPGYAIIGFSHPLANLRATINNGRWRQFGMAPSDKAVFLNQIHAVMSGSVKVIEVAS